MQITIVISQPMFFPWVGTFEKIKLASVYIHHDDIQFPKGWYSNRVQIKTNRGLRWLTVPLRRWRGSQLIKTVRIDNSQDWRRRHLNLFAEHYRSAPYKKDAIRIMENVYSTDFDKICELSIASTLEICDYFALKPDVGFLNSSQLAIHSKGSRRVLEIVHCLGGTTYICGAGNQKIEERYLDHDSFERHNIRVEYMEYQKISYRQLHGEFTPSVSVLDLVANMGVSGKAVIVSKSNYWKVWRKV